ALPILLPPDQLKRANRFRRLWSLYQQNLDLIQVGAYQQGANRDLDEAIALRAQMELFLQQGMHESIGFEECQGQIQQLKQVKAA
ncbi:MAG: flagellum-specific ATP synthase FliI, partial [Burkholderiaceae bacterium]